jgi:putative N6-adenine-specific DNA methylase
MLTGWHGECDLIDPFCGSGTILIEAALIAMNIYPGVFRKEYAFEKWKDFDEDMFDNIYNDDSKERDFDHKIYGFDINRQAVGIAIENARNAGVNKVVDIEQRDFYEFEAPREKALMITNPPYGERISTPDLLGTYRMIGERLKHQFLDNDAWILSYREECFEQIGLKPSIKIPLYNGSLECEFRKYQIFDGKLKNFRSEGGIVKTDDEKRQMAEKHRFKKNREFKQRLDEQEENEESDIRSFTFHRHDIGGKSTRDSRPSRSPRDDRDARDSRDTRKPRDFRDTKKSRGGHDRFDRSGGKKNKRFSNDED